MKAAHARGKENVESSSSPAERRIKRQSEQKMGGARKEAKVGR